MKPPWQARNVQIKIGAAKIRVIAHPLNMKILGCALLQQSDVSSHSLWQNGAGESVYQPAAV
jgi:hypothetical protein